MLKGYEQRFRFHIMAKLNKAIDEVRAKEPRELATLGEEPLLNHTRCCWLKQPRNLSEQQFTRLSDLVQYNPEGGAQLAVA